MLDPLNPDTWPPLIRLRDIVPDAQRNYPGIIPVSRASFLAGIPEGHYPAPVRLGAKMVAWRKADLVKFIERGSKRRRGKASRDLEPASANP
jgi:prophage regulatory protein